MFGTYQEIAKYFKKRKIARLVRSGIVPQNTGQTEIFEALRDTKKGPQAEVWGFLYAKIFRRDGTTEELGLQGVKEVTTVFAEGLVDCMVSSGGGDIEDFAWHVMGAGSTAETDTETALVDQVGPGTRGTQQHGATSVVYRTIQTLTATTTFGCMEHGIFDTTGGILLDRTLVANIALNTDDEVEWTYDLTVNAGG